MPIPYGCCKDLLLRASDWKLDQPDWTGRLRITSKGKIAYIKLEDKVSGELFAQAPVEQYPGIAVETVTDSSRYFVIRIQDGTGRSAFIGIGFTDRGDAFDFNVSLQDHFKWVKQESEISKESQDMDNRPKLDLGFKEGQTIKLSIGVSMISFPHSLYFYNKLVTLSFSSLFSHCRTLQLRKEVLLSPRLQGLGA